MCSGGQWWILRAWLSAAVWMLVLLLGTACQRQVPILAEVSEPSSAATLPRLQVQEVLADLAGAEPYGGDAVFYFLTKRLLANPDMRACLQAEDCQSLAEHVTSLLPLLDTECIHIADKKIYLRFVRARQVSIPGSKGQLAMAFSDELALAVRLKDAQTIVLEVVGGGMELRRGILARMFFPLLAADLAITEMHLSIPEPGEMLIKGYAIQEISHEAMSVNRAEDLLAIDISAPAWPLRHSRLSWSPQKMVVFGIEHDHDSEQEATARKKSFELLLDHVSAGRPLCLHVSGGCNIKRKSFSLSVSMRP